jgi:hypothetical protein
MSSSTWVKQNPASEHQIVSRVEAVLDIVFQNSELYTMRSLIFCFPFCLLYLTINLKWRNFIKSFFTYNT